MQNKKFIMLICLGTAVYDLSCANSKSIWEREGWEHFKPKLNEYGLVDSPLLYDGLVAVKIEEKWGYANRYGDLAIYPDYDEANDFSN